MRKFRAQGPFGAVAAFLFLIAVFQNCGPAKLTGDATPLPGQETSSSLIGTQVNLGTLLSSQLEASGNVIFPAPSSVPEFDYAQGAPVIENLALRRNDFTRIEWIHGPTSTIVALGDSLHQAAYSQELLGAYYVVGYREQIPYMLAQFRLVNKGNTTLNLSSVGSYQVEQQVIESDSAQETFLIKVEAPAVDLKSIQFVYKTNDLVIDNKRALLVTKKLSESMEIDVRLTDMAGQSATKSIVLPARAPRTQVLKLDAPNVSVIAGQALTLNLKFNAVPMTEDYYVFVSFVDSKGVEAPFSKGIFPTTNPTSKWMGAVTFPFSVTIPANVTLGAYSIRTGLFRNATAPNNLRIQLDIGPGVVPDDQVRYAVGTLNVTN